MRSVRVDPVDPPGVVVEQARGTPAPGTRGRAAPVDDSTSSWMRSAAQASMGGSSGPAGVRAGSTESRQQATLARPRIGHASARAANVAAEGRPIGRPAARRLRAAASRAPSRLAPRSASSASAAGARHGRRPPPRPGPQRRGRIRTDRGPWHIAPTEPQGDGRGSRRVAAPARAGASRRSRLRAGRRASARPRQRRPATRCRSRRRVARSATVPPGSSAATASQGSRIDDRPGVLGLLSDRRGMTG